MSAALCAPALSTPVHPFANRRPARSEAVRGSSPSRSTMRSTDRRRKGEASVLGGRDNSAINDPIKQYLDWCGSFPRLTREEEAELSVRALAGDEQAQDTLVNCNLKLVVSICKDFTRGKFPLLELVSAGNEGLIVASRKYDHEMGVPFANYASIWIKQRVMKYIAEHGFHVRVPPYRAAVVNQVVRAHGRLSQENGHAPSAEEIAAMLPTITIDEIREVMQLLQAPLELDRPMKEDGGTTTFGAYFGESAEDADDRLVGDLHKIDMQRAVREALSMLSEREAQVLVWFFGLNGQRSHDLEQIAHRLGVTRERARQIKSAALKKLASESESLLKYLA